MQKNTRRKSYEFKFGEKIYGDERLRNQRKLVIYMKKTYYVLLIVIALLISFSGCANIEKNSTLREISNDLNVNVSDGNIVAEQDSHGGFHGDGTSLVKIQFSDNQIEENIKNTQDWHAFPLDKTAQTILYGYKSENVISGPYLEDDDGNTLVPQIKNGYYWLKDRLEKTSNNEPETDIPHHVSLNFTIAVYDSDSKVLYYCKEDT